MTFSPPLLVFAFDEDGTLHVLANRRAAAIEYEGIDVESGTVRFFDEDGRSLRPNFVTPNKIKKLFGAIRFVESGAYELVADESSADGSFALALHGARLLGPNQWFSSLEDLRKSLKERGVRIERPS